MNKLPSREQALRILKEEHCSKKVIAHCEAVSKLAKETAETCRKKGLSIDVEVVEIGGLLHDVGRSRTHSVNHALVGAEIAQAKGLPESIISIIKCHIGGGITPVEARRLGWPRDDYVPRTLEQKIVSYADKLVEVSERVPIEMTVTKLREERLFAAAERVQKLHDEVVGIVGE